MCHEILHDLIKHFGHYNLIKKTFFDNFLLQRRKYIYPENISMNAGIVVIKYAFMYYDE